MKFNSELYDLTQNTQTVIYQAAFPLYINSLTEEERASRPQPNPLILLRNGYAESPAWMLVQVMEFLPEPLTVEKFRIRAVYSSPAICSAILELLASETWLNRVGNEYYLTDTGRVPIKRLHDNRVVPFANFEPIPKSEIRALEVLLGRVIQSSLTSINPPGTWCLSHSRRRAPDETTSAIAKIIQYASDFNAFRDDAHMAAQRAHDVDGHTWEAFNFVYTGNAKNAIELFELLAYRGYSTNEWQESLIRLAERGWLKLEDDNYMPTDRGKTVFLGIESLTDEYFYEPWRCLTSDETEELILLLQKLHDSCTKITNS